MTLGEKSLKSSKTSSSSSDKFLIILQIATSEISLSQYSFRDLSFVIVEMISAEGLLMTQAEALLIKVNSLILSTSMKGTSSSIVQSFVSLRTIF